MKVECVTNKFRDIPKAVYEGLHGYSSETELPIEVGQQSIVYGINIFKRHLWYLVEVQGLSDPMYYPSHLFKIIDGRLSKYWIVKEGKDSYDDNAAVIEFGFPEFIQNELFYMELLEDIPETVEIFKKYKKSMDNEFIDFD